ncbi:MAG TPA: hypothetical protein VMF61_02490 [Candidatus Acidoferrales bacterium]|nr:hypothetical protein [Candidatus Acidoferrales bacterium]
MDRYSARLDDAASIAEDVDYEGLLRAIAEFTLHAAVARAEDRSAWEQERFRREGLLALQFFRNGRALWADALLYRAEAKQAGQTGRLEPFEKANELQEGFCERLDRDLRAWWRERGYETETMLRDARTLFAELERDASDRACGAHEGFVREVLGR